LVVVRIPAGKFGREVQQRIDISSPPGVLPGEFQPKGDPP
jgi:hypothetical protein